MLSPEEQLASRATAAMTRAGPRCVNEIQQRISRAFPPASDPATPPHLRTGDLALGITSTVDELHDSITLNIVSEQPYSIFLRDGTGKMAARDYFGDSDRQLIEEIVRDEVQTEFSDSVATAATVP